MKNKIYLIVILSVLFSCSDFLEENPNSFLAPQAIRSEADVNNFFSGVMGRFASGNYYSLHYYYLTEGTTDMLTIRTSDEERTDLDRYTWKTDNSRIERVWRECWTIVANANNLLEGIENAEGLTDEFKNNFKSATRFARAYVYFDLVRLFDGVPIIESPVKGADEILGATRNSRSEVLNFVREELEAIEDSYTNDWNQDHVFDGYPTKWGAKATLTAVYLTLSGNEYNENRWQDAADKAKEIIDEGPFQLVDYSELFLVNNKNNQECIFSIQSHRNRFATASRPGGSRMGNQRGDGGLPIAREEIMDLWEDTDLRKASTFLTEIENILADGTSGGIVTYDIWTPNNFPFVAKWTSSGKAPMDFFSDARRDRTNFIVYRLGDILLMHAEAENETNGPGLAETSLNRVRTRASLPPLNGLGQSDFREAVRNERTLELSYEMKRRHDLIRWGILTETIRNNDPAAGENVQEHHKYYPIPQNDFDLLLDFEGQEGYEQERTNEEE